MVSCKFSPKPIQWDVFQPRFRTSLDLTTGDVQHGVLDFDVLGPSGRGRDSGLDDLR